MDDSPQAPEPRVSGTLLAVAILLSIALAIAVAWVDYLPTNDGPQHIFAAYLQAHLDEAGRGWHRYLDHGTLITGSGFVTLLGLLDQILPWRIAFRAAITGLALIWAWAVLALASSLGRRRRWLGLVGFATALQWQFYMGLFSCYLSTALGFLVLAVAFRFGLDRLRSLLLLAALFLLEANTHVVPAAITGLALLLYACISSPTASRSRVVFHTVLACLPALLVGMMAVLMAGGNDQLSRYSTSPPFARRIALLGRAFVSGPAWRAWPVTLLAVVACGVALGRWRQSPGDSRLRTLLLAGVALLALALATPLHIVGWEFFSVRFIPDAIVFLALLAPVGLPNRPAWARGATAMLVLFSLAAIAWGFAHHRFLHREHADFLAGLDAPLHREGPRLPLFLEPPPGEEPDDWKRAVPFVTTNLHVGPLFALAQGGVPAYLFAGVGAIHALSYRSPPEGSAMPARPARGYEWGLWEPAARANPSIRERALAHMLGFAPAYEDVIFWGTPSDHEVLRGRGFQPDFEQGGLMIARFVGCPARLRIEPPTAGLPPTLVLSGWWPDSRPTFSTTLAPRASNEPVELALVQSPCGPIWVRVLFDVNRDGKQSPGDLTCRGADKNAVLRQQVGPGADTVFCAAAEPLR